MQALTAHLERYGEGAVPLHVSASGTIGDTDESDEDEDTEALRETDRRLLALHIAGVADKAITSQTGPSRRTVQRRIRHIMTLTSSITRMQLARQAAHLAWL
ncbi:LuxR family transcriptional regulator [Streptomyces sp. NPDC059979]|uniref:LuxR family transcriptional regulator n=1 Tax=Streptomyces sp. NPDC059979 TaxID=3347021 RepID=UPI0036A06786